MNTQEKQSRIVHDIHISCSQIGCEEAPAVEPIKRKAACRALTNRTRRETTGKLPVSHTSRAGTVDDVVVAACLAQLGGIEGIVDPMLAFEPLA